MKKKWLPARIDIVTYDGEQSILDVGSEAVVTVIIKGPYVDLKFIDVMKLVVEPK